MALLRWLHLRKLTPLGDVIAALTTGDPLSPKPPAFAPRTPEGASASAPRAPADKSARQAVVVPGAPERASVRQASAVDTQPSVPQPVGTTASAAPAPAPAVVGGDFKEAFLAEIRRQKKFFHGTVVAQALRVDVERERVTFVFSPNHKALRVQLDQSRGWLETLASEIAGRKVTVIGLEGAAQPAAPVRSAAAPTEDRQTALKARALEDKGVQAMLDVFGAEIKNVEEM
jgi:hypothetical protein